jgi:hypothetical protein
MPNFTRIFCTKTYAATAIQCCPYATELETRHTTSPYANKRIWNIFIVTNCNCSTIFIRFVNHHGINSEEKR